MSHSCIKALRICFSQIPVENKERIEYDVDELVKKIESFGIDIKNEGSYLSKMVLFLKKSYNFLKLLF